MKLYKYILQRAFIKFEKLLVGHGLPALKNLHSGVVTIEHNALHDVLRHHSRMNGRSSLLEVRQQVIDQDRVDAIYGIKTLKQTGEYIGYMYNMHETYQLGYSANDELVSALECYFVRQNLTSFKIKIPYRPYILLSAPVQNYDQILILLEKLKIQTEKVERQDSAAPNHVAGKTSEFLKVIFDNRMRISQFLQQLTNRGALPLQNQLPKILLAGQMINSLEDLYQYISKICESDVGDGIRIAIDKQIRCAKWYKVIVQPNNVHLEPYVKLQLPPKLRVLAYDIETTKQPLCFPNAQHGDQVMCISYMLDEQGILLINRQIFSQNIEDFEYSPKETMQAHFKVFNLQNEREVLCFFLDQIRLVRPQVIVTFNGDSFDFKFVHQRCEILQIDWNGMGFVTQETRGKFSTKQSEYTHPAIVHIDCLRWVMRDSYLPQGSQGLKAVTREKLKYVPMELSPEDMTPFARQRPQLLAQYSVSDAVATYYLYKQFIEAFIFALCTIIPLNPDQVLRKGTGTLCETLLMVEATCARLLYPEKIGNQGMQLSYIDPQDPLDRKIAEAVETNYCGCNNKLGGLEQGTLDVEDLQFDQITKIHTQQLSRTAQQRVLISQTYVGGRVEAINSGIYRSDFEYAFMDGQEAVQGYQELIDRLDQDLELSLYQRYSEEIDALGLEEETEALYPVARTRHFIAQNIVDYAHVREQLRGQLERLRDRVRAPFTSKPIIYHLDVAAMYPNIILTNRLQPHAVVSPHFCNSCDYNRDRSCKRVMTWMWRGIYYPCTAQEYQMVLARLQAERGWAGIGRAEHERRVKQALDVFCQKTYHAKQKTLEQYHQSTICQRENPFYYDTVRNFRNRRYEYKKKQAAAFRGYQAAEKASQAPGLSVQERSALQEEAEHQRALVTLNESLQLAHKAILNSFYGYAMRAGSRWFSMEMAACTTFIGSQIIKRARSLIELVGVPLELDTDGIWSMLPHDFPSDFSFSYRGESKITFQYPAVMLNALTVQYFTNEQFQTREADTHHFQRRPECSISFEIDGPYKAMFLSAAKEEGRRIKKRYCVFDFKGQISELKGFEIKRRGELQLIKKFQERVFIRFLSGTTLLECYGAAAAIADHFLDILRNRGVGYERALILDLLQESSTMKLSLEETASDKKGAAITTAKRLSKSLDEVFGKVAGLTCQFVISKYPVNTPVSDRAIPVQIFDTGHETRAFYISQWTQQTETELSDILDWEYYEQRFVNCLMRLIIVPAGLQGLKESPVSRVPFPPWLQEGKGRQLNLEQMMQLYNKNLGEDDTSSDQEEDDAQQEQEPSETNEVTVEEIMRRYGLTFSEPGLKILHQLQSNKVSRAESAQLWLEQQTRKWRNLVINEQLNKSIEQIRRESFYQSEKRVARRRIISNDIFSQLQGRIRTNDYVVLNARQKQLNHVQLTLFNPQQREIKQVTVNIKKEIIINTQTTNIQNMEDNSVVITELRTQDQRYQLQDPHLFAQLPNGQKIVNLYRLEIDEDFYKRNIQFFDQQFSFNNVLGVYHRQMSLVERFLIYNGCFVELTAQGAQEMDFGLLQYQNIRQLSAQPQAYLFDRVTKRFILPVHFCIFMKLDEGEIFCILDQSQFKILTTIELQPDDLVQLHASFIQELEKLIMQLSTQNSSLERQILLDILKSFSQVADNKQILPNSTTRTETLFQQYVNKCDANNTLIFFFTMSASGFPPQSQENKSVFITPQNNVFIRISNINISQEEISIVSIMLELLAQFSQLENYCIISQVPIINLLYNKQFYNNSNQTTRLTAMDFLYARQLVKNKHVIWISHTGYPDNGKQQLSIQPNAQVNQIMNPGFYYSISIIFDIQYLFAQVIIQSLRHNKQLGVLSRMAQATLMTTPSLLKYLEEYIFNNSSMLYSQAHANIILSNINNFVYHIYNVCFSKQITPLYISSHKLILNCDKIDEQLAVLMYRQFLQEFLAQFEVIQLDVKQILKQFIFLDLNNYIGLTIQNTIYRKSIYESLMSQDYVESAQTVIASYLLNVQKYIDEIDPKVSSVLQLGDIDGMCNHFQGLIRDKLLNCGNQEDYISHPNQFINSMKNISELRMETYDSQIKDILCRDQQPGWLYINYIFGTLQYDGHISQNCQSVINSLKNLFTNSRSQPVRCLPPLRINIYCQKCQEYVTLDLSTDLQNMNLQCLNCQHSLKKHEVEEIVFKKIQEIFLNQQADQGYVLDEYQEVVTLYGMRCVSEQIRIMKGLV